MELKPQHRNNQSEKSIVYKWFMANREILETEFHNNEKIALLFHEKHPGFKSSHYTVQKWIKAMRKGEWRDLDAIKDAVVDVYDDKPVNIKELFTEHLETDLNPLGVLDQADINRIFVDIPETFSDYKAPVKITGVKHLGIISDIHFPIHNRIALLAAFSKLKQLNIDGLYLNGDIMDCGGVTHFERRRVINYTWEQELAVGRAFFKSLRVLFPNIPIWYKMGNHEDWLPRYLAKRAPEIANTYQLGVQLGIDALNITIVESHQVAIFGKLWIAHGHELGLRGGTLNIARQVLMRTNVNIIVGHWHKNDQHERRNLDETVVSSWVTGCIADLHPEYNPSNQMTHGMASAELLDQHGTFVVHPYKIVNGLVIG